MTVLVDTQVWIWMVSAPERLSREARALVDALENDLLFSVASAWEIAIKYRIGKLTLPEPPATYVPSRLGMQGLRFLAIGHEHALHVGTLPLHHRDPFDRLLIAQAQLEDLSIITADRQFSAYDVRIIPA